MLHGCHWHRVRRLDARRAADGRDFRVNGCLRSWSNLWPLTTVPSLYSVFRVPYSHVTCSCVTLAGPETQASVASRWLVTAVITSGRSAQDCNLFPVPEKEAGFGEDSLEALIGAAGPQQLLGLPTRRGYTASRRLGRKWGRSSPGGPATSMITLYVRTYARLNLSTPPRNRAVKCAASCASRF